MWRFRGAALAGLGMLAVVLVFTTGAAGQGEHGLGGSTNCVSPTKVGDPVFCTYTIRNNSDDFGDTMRAHSVIATANSPGGSVGSGNIFGSLAWVFTGTVTCTGGTGTGTLASPRVGATSCDISDGARIASLPFSFYTAKAIDATVPFIPMLADYAATDLCNGPGSTNCPVNDLSVGVSSSTTVVKRNSATATQIHDAGHQTVTTVPAGTTVHDFVMVTSTDGGPIPTGNVNIDWFLNGDCTGNPAQNSGSIGPLDAAGNFDATGFAFTVSSSGMRAFRAHYEGSGTYNSSNGACEPLQVNDTAPPCPAGSFTYSVAANGDLVIKYDQFPAPNDNSYGVNAVGWGTKGHTFGNLVGSDHAGFRISDPNGVAKLDFEIDYISTKTGTPSGYASLGPFGGDGGINTGTLTPADITFDTSLARNLNNTGYFAGGVQVVGNAVANLLVDSPPTLNTTDSYVLTPAAAAVFNAPNPDSAESPGWNFHDTYFVTIKAAKLAAMGFDANTWKVEPNDDELHNSPAKPCPCVANLDPNPTIDVHDNGNGTTTVTFTQSLAVNDNSYGTGTDPTWGTKTHTFSNLLGSDKAEFRFTNGNGQVVNDFFIDYLSAKPGTTSGYGTLCASGGDGSLVSGPLPVSCSTSLDQNLNGIPCPSFTTNSPTSPGPDAACPAWEFKSIYTVTVSNATFGPSGFGGVTIPAVHNSPSKPLTCPTGTGQQSQCNFTITKKERHDKQIRITIKNNGSVDEFISAINLTWPAATNGKLTKIKLDGDVIYDNPDIAGGTASLTAAQLASDQNKRKIGKGQSDVLIFEFEKNADADLTHYTGSLSFGPNCTLTILP